MLLPEQELDSSFESRLWRRTALRRPELRLGPVAVCLKVSPSWKVLLRISMMKREGRISAHTVIEVDAQVASVR